MNLRHTAALALVGLFGMVIRFIAIHPSYGRAQTPEDDWREIRPSAVPPIPVQERKTLVLERRAAPTPRPSGRQPRRALSAVFAAVAILRWIRGCVRSPTDFCMASW
jgi:hypothetical protein